MTRVFEKHNPQSPAARKRAADADHMQMMEGNPLDADDRAMFEMFDREGWSYEERESYIIGLFSRERNSPAAE